MCYTHNKVSKTIGGERKMKERSLRILHLANTVLGSPYTGLSLEDCHACYKHFPEVFDSVFTYIEKEKIDLVLVAGNLCGRYLSNEDAAHLIRKFSEASCRFVIAPGDQDPYMEDSLYASGRLPKNVTVFESEGLERVALPELGASVYGWAILGQRSHFSPLAGARPKDPDEINLVVGSCAIAARTLFAHISPEEIAAFGADYAAFAHGAATPVRKAGKTYYCHAGFLEGRNFDELGEGGVMRIDIEEKDGVRHVTPRFVKLSHHRFEILTMDVTGVTNMQEVTERLGGMIADLGFSENTSLRVILEGELHPTTVLRQSPEDGRAFHLYSLEFIDRTMPTLHAEELERDMSVRGELYRTLRERLSSQNLDERIAVAQALRAGLAALDARDITIP